ncbi:MAG: AAA family ATPase [Planctomycetota bacterium]
MLEPDSEAEPRFREAAMLTRMTIENFRGFRHLEVPVLPQVTLLTGSNGSGKTSLLEAVFALYGRNTPAWILNVQARRGFARISAALGPRYTGLFYGFKDEGEATIRGQGHDGSKYRVQIIRAASQLVTDVALSTATAETAHAGTDLVLRSYHDEQLENESSLSWRLGKDGTPAPQIINARPARPMAMLLHPGTKEAVDERGDVERFGAAKTAGRAQAIVNGLRLIHPMIEDVEFLPTQAGENFYARTNGDYIPLGLLGGGVNNLLRYLVSLDYVRGGFLGIDEIENGIHHTALPDVFRTLVQRSIETDTQLMMATHSGEAVSALSAVAQEYMPPLNQRIGAIHAARAADDAVRLTWFVGEELTSSVELGYEIR